MAAFDLFPGNIVLLVHILAIIDFGVLCKLWLFAIDVPLMEKPGCLFTLTKSVKNTVEE